MENAVDAMKMAFAMLVFLVALSLSIYSFTMVRQTSDRITQEADQKEYYDRLTLDETGESTGIAPSALAASSRIVGIETVIPTLYRYYKENYTVLFYKGTGYNETNGTFTSIEPMVLYHTESDYTANSSLLISSGGVFGFDIQDEQARREPWSANEETAFRFIRAFINGTETDPFYTSKTSFASGRVIKSNEYGRYYTIDFDGSGPDESMIRGLIGTDLEFVERFGEYNSSIVFNEDDTEVIDSSITGSVDVLENGEIVTRRNQTTKRVIQYILIN